MKEVVRSKVMMGFLVFVIGLVMVSGNGKLKMEENEKEVQETLITMNIQ